LETFAQPFLDALPNKDSKTGETFVDDFERERLKEEFLDEVVEMVKPVCCDYEGKWTLDYVRLRVKAVAP
jgi:hypothetical protein